MFEKLRSIFRKGGKRGSKTSSTTARHADIGLYQSFSIEPLPKQRISYEERPSRIRRSFRRQSSLSLHGNDGGGYMSDSLLSRRSSKRYRQPVVWDEYHMPAGQRSGAVSADEGAGKYYALAHRKQSRSHSVGPSPLHPLQNQHEFPSGSRSNVAGGPKASSKPSFLPMIVNNDFSPCCKGELPVEQGQHITALFRHNDWLYVRARSGAEGYVPIQYCTRDQRFANQSKSTMSLNQQQQIQENIPASMSLPANSFPIASCSAAAAAAAATAAKPQPSSTMPVSASSRSRGSSLSHDVFSQPSQSTMGGKESHRTSLPSFNNNYSGQGYSPGKTPGRSTPGNFSTASTSNVFSTSSYSARPSAYSRATSRAAMSDSELATNKQSLMKQQSHSQAQGAAPTPPTSKPHNLCRCVALYDFVQSQPTEVTMLRGEKAYVLNSDNQHWLWVSCKDGRKGYVPRSFVVLEDSLTNPKVKDNNRRAAHGSDTELQLALRAETRRRTNASTQKSIKPIRPYLSGSHSDTGLSSGHRSASFRRATSADSVISLASQTFSESAVDVPNDLLDGTLGKTGQRARSLSNPNPLKRENRWKQNPLYNTSKKGKTLPTPKTHSTSNGVVVLWGFEAQRPGQVSVERSEWVRFVKPSKQEMDKDWVKVVNQKGATGYIPSACIKPAPSK
ncbi:uncharacterized protein LOC135814747 [Sycon ciliatum]|uniref:uncharacterized protein LOC135814747 n=1 Tax=Sycon ciliatum TaxID=27933 RepID=UPI0031F69741|eukprot:scpid25678/ scgid22137/ 